jgi:hypothetical protein
MLKIYCQSCGAKYEYSNSKPNFCSKCGTNLNQFSNYTKAELIVPENIEEELDSLKVPKINNLEVEISKSELISEKISDIISSSPEEEYEDFKQLIENNQTYHTENEEQFLKDFSEEAGALRPKIREHKTNVKNKNSKF